MNGPAMPVVLLPQQFSICLSSGLMSQQPVVSSLARTEESRASSNRLGMSPPGEAIVDWEWDLQEKQSVEKSRRRCCQGRSPGDTDDSG